MSEIQNQSPKMWQCMTRVKHFVNEKWQNCLKTRWDK